MGLRHKLLLLWLVLLLLPLSVMGTIGYYYIDSNLREDAAANIEQTVTLQRQSVENFFSRLEFIAQYVADVPALQETLAKSSQTSDAQVATARASVSQIMGIYSAINEIQLVDGRNFSNPLLSVTRRNASVPILIGEDSEHRDLISKVSDSEPTLFYLPGKGRRGSLVVMSPIYSASSENISGNATSTVSKGFVVIISSMELLDEFVNPISNLGSQFFVTHSKGNVLTQNSLVPFTRLDFSSGQVPRLGTQKIVVSDYAIGTKSYTLSMMPLRYGFWLGALTDNEILLEQKLPYIVIFAMCLSLTLLLSGALFNFVVVKIVLKPVQALIHATQQIAKGDFRPELDVKNKDELGDLALAFRHMGKQLRHSSRRIRQLAYYDPLTQLPNRTTLRETLNRLLMQSKRSNWKTAVLFIDLDDFKKVNDRLGHAAGDELLVQISDRLKNRLRQSDMLFDQSAGPSVDQLISRRGGDEFNAILSSIKAPHDAAVVAERIIQDLNEPFNISGSEIHVGASVGIAIYPDDGADADTLLRNADLAMYEAKAKGKNNYHIFTSAINKQVHQRLALENALQSALVQGQFRLYYQPKVRLQDMKTVGFEALIRWYEPKQGMILPGKFIPIAEESNLIRDIGNWILGESMQQIQLWEKQLPHGVRIAINISARQLAQADLVDQLQMMMEHFSLSPQRLEVELTETSVLQDEVMAGQHLNDLRALGVEVSLDDFGTGYSSLNFLRKLPIDTVKIDRSFTANVTRSGETRAIVVSLLNLCRQLNVKSIAEGIETTEQLQFMLEHGCDQGQGFLFSEPLPSNEVMVFLEEPSFLALAPEV